MGPIGSRTRGPSRQRMPRYAEHNEPCRGHGRDVGKGTLMRSETQIQVEETGEIERRMLQWSQQGSKELWKTGMSKRNEGMRSDAKRKKHVDLEDFSDGLDS